MLIWEQAALSLGLTEFVVWDGLGVGWVCGHQSNAWLQTWRLTRLFQCQTLHSLGAGMVFKICIITRMEGLTQKESSSL